MWVSTYYKHIGFKALSTAILGRLPTWPMNWYKLAIQLCIKCTYRFPNALADCSLSNAPRWEERFFLILRFQRAVAKKIYKGVKDGWENSQGIRRTQISSKTSVQISRLDHWAGYFFRIIFPLMHVVPHPGLLFPVIKKKAFTPDLLIGLKLK